MLSQRISEEEVLDSFLRGSIFNYVRDNPGTRLCGIRKALRQRNTSGIVYHLDTLEKFGLIRSYYGNETRKKPHFIDARQPLPVPVEPSVKSDTGEQQFKSPHAYQSGRPAATMAT